mmetsp:Transcript_17669/g.57772  ORF Transcript_17669/g.57772 Transcript_17669/m.57772 type:complete len:226 (-) Transcript_17669:929-1606(-)
MQRSPTRLLLLRRRRRRRRRGRLLLRKRRGYVGSSVQLRRRWRQPRLHEKGHRFLRRRGAFQARRARAWWRKELPHQSRHSRRHARALRACWKRRLPRARMQRSARGKSWHSSGRSAWQKSRRFASNARNSSARRRRTARRRKPTKPTCSVRSDASGSKFSRIEASLQSLNSSREACRRSSRGSELRATSPPRPRIALAAVHLNPRIRLGLISCRATSPDWCSRF